MRNFTADCDLDAPIGFRVVSKKPTICRHCQCRNVNRPKGLCWTCYYAPGVREQYPSANIYANRGTGLGFRLNAPLPAQPTMTAPGSSERIEVLAGRAERGEQLWHPLDVKADQPVLAGAAHAA